MPGVVGVDLAGLPTRITGLCFLDLDLGCELARAGGDDEILSFIFSRSPRVVAIDAPLSFPRRGMFRACELELRGLGARPLSPLLRSMKALTARGIRLKRALEDQGYEVVEVFPTGSRRFLGLPPKRAGRKALLEALRAIGVKGIPSEADQHLLDAVICALIGLHYLRGQYLRVGDPEEGVIILPAPRSSSEGGSLGEELG